MLSAYRSASHGHWADWLLNTFNNINWHKLELPGRNFRWRIRGNPLSWLNQLPTEKPDLIIATSMVDLSTLKGLHKKLAQVPCVYYFHENQFAYPDSGQQHSSVDPQMVQLYGALAADQVLFNSAYNRDSFFIGISTLLQQLPDCKPTGLLETLHNKADILPVPIQAVKPSSEKLKSLIVWNHRWEYDKAPQVFYQALKQLQQSEITFQLALLGERQADAANILKNIENEFAENILISQQLDRASYEQVLSQASLVVSTAIHEFQGLSVLEAVSAGATPLVPDDLCYQEQYEEIFRYPTGDSHALAKKLMAFLQHRPQAPDVSSWYQENLYNSWHELLTQ